MLLKKLSLITAIVMSSFIMGNEVLSNHQYVDTIFDEFFEPIEVCGILRYQLFKDKNIDGNWVLEISDKDWSYLTQESILAKALELKEKNHPKYLQVIWNLEDIHLVPEKYKNHQIQVEGYLSLADNGHHITPLLLEIVKLEIDFNEKKPIAVYPLKKFEMMY